MKIFWGCSCSEVRIKLRRNELRIHYMDTILADDYLMDYEDLGLGIVIYRIYEIVKKRCHLYSLFCRTMIVSCMFIFLI